MEDMEVHILFWKNCTFKQKKYGDEWWMMVMNVDRTMKSWDMIYDTLW